MAGKITVNTLQIGDSGTATNNFHLETNVDGSLSLNRGNDGTVLDEVLRVNSSGQVITTPVKHQVKVSGYTGHGSTNTRILRATTIDINVGTSITYADSATLGASFTINDDGVYAFTMQCRPGAASAVAGFSLNTTTPTTSISSVSNAERLGFAQSYAVNSSFTVSYIGYFSVGDVVRPHDDGGTQNSEFQIFAVRVG